MNKCTKYKINILEDKKKLKIMINICYVAFCHPNIVISPKCEMLTPNPLAQMHT